MTLSDLLARFAHVVEERDGYVTPCPAHSDSRPSLRVALSADGHIILKCRAGCATDAVVSALGLTFADLRNATPGEAVKTTSAQSAAPGPRDVAGLALYLGQAAERLADFADPDAQVTLDYAAARFGLDASTCVALGLGADPGGNAYPFERLGTSYRRVARLVVPFRDFDGNPRGMQARALTPDAVRWCGPTNPEGASWTPLAVFKLDTGLNDVLVTEGPGDALTAVGAGFDAVAIRGAALSGNKAVTDALAAGLRGRRVIVAGDRDSAGAAFTARIAEALAGHGLQIHTLTVPAEPADGDLSGWYAHNPAAFSDALHRAVRAAKEVGAPDAPAPVTTATAAKADDGYPQTDLGNARRLHAHLDGLVRYSPELGFFMWDGAVWVLDKLDTIRTTAHAVASAMVTEGQDELDAIADKGGASGKAAARKVAWGLRSQSTRSIDAMVRELSAMQGVALDVETLDSRHDLLAMRNGTVDLRTGALRPHDPADLMTRKIDVDYDPSAVAPTWDYFLNSVFPGHEDTLPAFMQRLVGYGITGHTDEQCFAVLWGKGANGKSVFVDTLTSVFRAVTTTTPFSTFETKPSGGIPNDLAALKGARLVMASEGEQGRQMAEAVIKRVTGADMISARFMRREFFEFKPTFLIWLATNHKPDFRGQDDGLWRRVKLIPWARFFAPHERDHHLTAKLRAEAAGIAAWAVRGAMAWYAGGLQEPDVVRHATADYRSTSDRLAGFLPGALIREEGASIVGSEAYLMYRDWCREEGFRDSDVWQRNTLYKALEERGIPRMKKERGQTLMGVRAALPGENPEAHGPRTAEASPVLVKAANPPKAPSLDEDGVI